MFTATHNKKFAMMLVNFFRSFYTFCGDVRPKELQGPIRLIPVGPFALEVVMQAHPKLSKSDQRELMRVLKDRRERQTPGHHSPAWLHAYWRRIAA